MKISKLLAISALTLGAAFASYAQAPAEPPARPPQAPFLERAREKLGLTDEQVTKIKAELQAQQETLRKLILKLHDARAALRDAIQDPAATEASVRAAASKVGAVQTDLAVERFKLVGRINPILTQEQRDKVKQHASQLDEFIDGAINRLGERLAEQQQQ
jgi:Spy/CpxP family protein refolding chaperone